MVFTYHDIWTTSFLKTQETKKEKSKLLQINNKEKSSSSVVKEQSMKIKHIKKLYIYYILKHKNLAFIFILVEFHANYF